MIVQKFKYQVYSNHMYNDNQSAINYTDNQNGGYKDTLKWQYAGETFFHR